MKTELLTALNTAAASLQRAAHSEAAVFRAVREQIGGLGLRGGLSLLDETGERLVVHAVAYPGPMGATLAGLEKLVGLKAEGFAFDAAGVDAYRQVVESGEAAFVPDSSAVVAQLLPPAARPFAGRILKAFGAPPAIFAPLMSEGQVRGALNVVGAGLTPDDVPAMAAFANHVAVALDNARLLSALRESEGRFRDLYEKAPNAYFSVGADGLIRRCNRRAGELLGYALEELVGRPVLELYADTPQGKEKAERVFQRFQAGETITDEELQMQKADGAPVWISLTVNVVQDAEGQVVESRSMAVDITARVRAEQALRRSNKELAALFAIDRAAAQSLDLEEILADALDETLAVLEVEAGGITLMDPDGETMTLRVHRGLSDEFVEATRRIRVGEGVSGQAVAGGKPVVLDVPDYPTGRLAPFVVEEGFRTVASTPLISEGQAVGALTLGALRPRAFPPQELELLAAIGRQLGIAFAKAQLHEETKRWADRLALINEVGQVAAGTLDSKALFQTTVAAIANRFEFHGVNAFSADHASQEVALQAAAGPHAGLIPPDYRQPFDTGIIGWVAQHGETLLANDVTQEPRFVECFPEAADSYLSELAVPIKIEDSVVGVLDVEGRQLNAFKDVDVATVEALADRLASAIANVELYEQLAQANRQLEEKIEKLETFYRITMGREKRIMELKEEIRELKERLGESET